MSYWKLAWDRTKEIWSYKTSHGVRHVLTAIGALAAAWLFKDIGVVTETAQVALVVAAFFFGPMLLTFVWQLFRAPQVLHRKEELNSRALRDEIAEFSTPKLEVFSVEVQRAMEKDRAVSPPVYWHAFYIKVGVRSKHVTVENVRAYMTAVRRKLPSGEHREEKIDPIALMWSLTDQKTIELENGIDRYFDVLTCSQTEPLLHHGGGVVWPLMIRKFFNKAAVYQVDIAISGKGSRTTKLTVEIDYKNWNHLTARQVETIEA